MRNPWGASALVGAALCAAVTGCGSGSGLAAPHVCIDLREVSADYQDRDINTATYVSALQSVARDARAIDDPDMRSAGASLESAVRDFDEFLLLVELPAVTQAADRLSDVCGERGL